MGPMQELPPTLMLPPLTISGPGTVQELLPRCAESGRRGVLVHGHSLERSGTLAALCAETPAEMDLQTWRHPGGEPTLTQLEALLAAARAHRAEWIAGVGGGSVIDMAKACAGLLEAPLPPVAYQDGATIPTTRIPLAAVPTTAGTGSEATIVSVLTNEKTNLKRSIRHLSFMPRLVILDPKLLRVCPSGVIAASGMDAFTQAVESFWSRNSTPLTEGLSLRAAVLIAGSLEAVFDDAGCGRAGDLLTGSYLAGVALSNARLGVVHGLAHPLGARYRVPHGLACAVCLPHAIAFNRDAIGEKYSRLCDALGEDAATLTTRLLDRLGLESPFAGKAVADREQVVTETLASGSTKANPRDVTADDVEALLDALFAG
jgi:alcohol dehydrogenase class IV